MFIGVEFVSIRTRLPLVLLPDAAILILGTEGLRSFLENWVGLVREPWRERIGWPQ